MLKGPELFKSLYVKAIEESEPCANFLTFTTIDSDGLPHSRILTIRSITESLIGVYVNGSSPKMIELTNNNKWELSGFWPKQMVQFRMRGSASYNRPVSLSENWKKKNQHSRLADVYHSSVRQQSSIVEDREQLLSEISTLSENTELDKMPESVVFLEFNPEFYEIWIGSMENRLHDRTVHKLKEGNWEVEVLVP